jgi:hypothetical protein
VVGNGHGLLHLEQPMKLRILQQLVGPTINLMQGDVVDLPSDLAARLIEAKIAEAVQDERATLTEVQRKATKR